MHSTDDPEEDDGFTEIVGEGACGIVYGKVGNQEVVKSMPLYQENNIICPNLRETLTYLDMLQGNHIPGVIRPENMTLSNNNVLITFPRGIELGTWVRSTSLEKRLSMLDSLLDKLVGTVGAFHDAGYRHWDLKETNVIIFLSKDGSTLIDVYMCDLGTIKRGDESLCKQDVDNCMADFRAPETFEADFPRKYYSNHNDVYGLGCILHFVIHAKYYKFRDCNEIPEVERVPAHVDRAMRSLLNHDAQTRACHFDALRMRLAPSTLHVRIEIKHVYAEGSKKNDRIRAMVDRMSQAFPLTDVLRETLTSLVRKYIDLYEENNTSPHAMDKDAEEMCYFLAISVILPFNIVPLGEEMGAEKCQLLKRVLVGMYT